MNFVQFIENRFQELRYKQSFEEIEKKPFNAALDSEIKATHELLTTYRWVLKWLLKPKVMGHFVLVAMGMAKKPEPILLNKLKEQEELKKKMAEEEKCKNELAN